MVASPNARDRPTPYRLDGLRCAPRNMAAAHGHDPRGLRVVNDGAATRALATSSHMPDLRPGAMPERYRLHRPLPYEGSMMPRALVAIAALMCLALAVAIGILAIDMVR